MNNLFNPQLSKLLIIGTKSKSRKKLFKALNLNFNYKSANINEKNVPNLKNNKFDALKIATAKAMHLSSKYKNKVIITFDTTILFQKKTIYKCKDIKCCKNLLKSLTNKRHSLYTGMVFMINNKIIQKKITETKINFKKIHKSKINLYVNKNYNNIKSAVGCYNIEGSGKNLFEKIHQSYFNIIGVDIINFLKYLRKI